MCAHSASNRPLGFQNRTDIVTLATGDRVVVQRSRHRRAPRWVTGRESARSQAHGLARRWALDDMLASAPYPLYRATVSQHLVLDPDGSPGDRAEVTP